MSTTSTTTLLQNSPYLREQRQFPLDDVRQISKEINQAYTDIAQKVNARTIGIYAKNYQLVTGDSWYLTSSRQQALRQIYTFTSTGSIAHGINPASIDRFVQCYGSYTDGTNYYGVIYATSVVIVGQITFYITPTNIVIQAGAGAPSITSGIITLQWLSPV